MDFIILVTGFFEDTTNIRTEIVNTKTLYPFLLPQSIFKEVKKGGIYRLTITKVDKNMFANNVGVIHLIKWAERTVIMGLANNIHFFHPEMFEKPQRLSAYSFKAELITDQKIIQNSNAIMKIKNENRLKIMAEMPNIEEIIAEEMTED